MNTRTFTEAWVIPVARLLILAMVIGFLWRDLHPLALLLGSTLFLAALEYIHERGEDRTLHQQALEYQSLEILMKAPSTIAGVSAFLPPGYATRRQVRDALVRLSVGGYLYHEQTQVNGQTVYVFMLTEKGLRRVAPPQEAADVG